MSCKIIKIGIGLLFFCWASGKVFAQSAQKFGDQPFTLDKSAVLELQSVTKGFLPPRMTTAQRNVINKPAKGLIIYNVSTNAVEVNAGTLDAPVWVAATSSNPAISATRKTDNYTLLASDSTVLFDASAKDLTATLPDAASNTGKIFYLRKDDESSNMLTIAPNVNANGKSFQLVLNYTKTIKVQSDGTIWVVID